MLLSSDRRQALLLRTMVGTVVFICRGETWTEKGYVTCLVREPQRISPTEAVELQSLHCPHPPSQAGCEEQRLKAARKVKVSACR